MEYSINPIQYKNDYINSIKKYGLNLNLNNPQTIQEKLAWLNIYDANKLKTKCADKILLHDYCKEKLGKDICIPIIKVYDKPQNINFDELPDKFVAKCNHGSGMNIIVKDKKTANKKEIIDKLNTWLCRDFTFQNGFEAHYYDIKRKCFVETFMDDGNTSLYDYKFWCFNGEPKFYTINDGFGHSKWMYFYDMNQNKLPLKRTDYCGEASKEVKQPSKFGEMVEYTKKLSEPFKFVRVDFYEVNGTVYLGELTFTPGACLFQYQNHEDEIKVGNMLDLCINKKNNIEEITNKDVCVVIPIYKDNINKSLLYDEVESILNTIIKLKDNDIYFLHHPDINISFYKKFIKYKNVHFITYNYKNREEYSNMCLSYKFYEMFKKYKYMLICQTDAYIFKNELLYWCNKGYDYIGALGFFTKITYPYKGKWDDENVGDIYNYPYIVMNGGFSLRNVRSFYDFCLKNKDIFEKETFNEDCIICWYHWYELNMPPLEEAIKFSAENQTYAFYPKYYNNVPFGCHTLKTKYKLLNIFFKNN